MRPPWWKTTLMRNHPDERRPWWETTLVKNHLDKRPPWSETILVRDHPEERTPWKETTLMRDHSSFKITFSETIPFIFPCKWAPHQSTLFLRPLMISIYVGLKEELTALKDPQTQGRFAVTLTFELLCLMQNFILKECLMRGFIKVLLYLLQGEYSSVVLLILLVHIWKTEDVHVTKLLPKGNEHHNDQKQWLNGLTAMARKRKTIWTNIKQCLCCC